MSDLNKYQGVIPAFYACYDGEGNISPERVRGLTRHLIGKGVNGLYVGGASHIQSVDPPPDRQGCQRTVCGRLLR